MSSLSLEDLAGEAISRLTKADHSIAVAESLTGGDLCGALVCVSGASEVVRGGVVAYQAPIKTKVLGVSAEVIASSTTVCPAVARQMARGVSELMDADFALATTGVAGPGPSEGHPAGTVYVCLAQRLESAVAGEYRYRVLRLQLAGERNLVRLESTSAALRLLCDHFDGCGSWD